MSSCADFVDGDLLVIKTIFFFFFSGMACIHPYIAVYMRHQGLLPSQIGVIKSAGNFMSVIIKPLLGSIADKTGRPKMVAILTVVTASILYFSMVFIPPVPSSTALTQATRQQRHLAESEKSGTDYTQSRSSLTFWLFFWIIFFSHGVHWSAVSQLEAATYQIMKKNGGGEFGRQRALGSVGFALFAVLSGVAMDTFPSESQYPGNGTGAATDNPDNKNGYSVGFYMFLTFMVLTVTFLLLLKDWSTESCTGFLKSMGRLLSQVHLLIVLFVVLVLGACDGASDTYLFLHLKNLGASQTVLGTYLMVKNAAEIPFYIVACWVIRKLGHVATIGSSFLIFSLRFLLYSFVSNPWWVVVESTLNGYHAVTWAAATSYASISALDDLQAFAQGVVATTFYGLGHSLGNVVGGPIFQGYGALVFFRSFAVSCLIGFLLFYVLYMYFGRKQNPTERHSDNVEESEAKSPLVLASEAESESQKPEPFLRGASLKPGAFLCGGNVTNGAGEHIGVLRIVKPQDRN
ncbi:major facilitator superfamily domain-containing protein 6-like isoform X2 [Branchiostoma floridae x Branchiostoma japonicum]